MDTQNIQDQDQNDDDEDDDDHGDQTRISPFVKFIFFSKI